MAVTAGQTSIKTQLDIYKIVIIGSKKRILVALVHYLPSRLIDGRRKKGLAGIEITNGRESRSCEKWESKRKATGGMVIKR